MAPGLKPSFAIMDEKRFSDASTLTLEQALERALARNPELAASHLEILALEGQALQAGLISNPELEFELEHFAGSGDFQGVDSMERTARLNQRIELAGKRTKRRKAASLEVLLARLDYEEKRLEVIAQTHRDFVDTLSAQKRMNLAKELVGLAEEVLKTVSERVRAGKAAPLEETRARVALSKTLIDLRRAAGERATTRKRLSSNWGSGSRDFKRVEGDLETTRPLPSQEELRGLVLRNPALIRLKLEEERSEALLKVEWSNQWPDLTVEGGLRYYDESDDRAFVAGVSFPLPLFDRNQGAISNARNNVIKTRHASRAATVNVTIALEKAYQELSTALAQVAVLRKDILPGAHEAFEAAREGYRQGKFGYLDVLDSQRTLFEARTQYFEVLADYHKAQADVERLTGASRSNITGLDQKESSHES